MTFAIIDTNVLVSSQMTRHDDAATRQVVKAVFDGNVTPVVTPAILAEYQDVLSRPKLNLHRDVAVTIVSHFSRYGLFAEPQPYSAALPDEKDRMFLEAALGVQSYGAVLVTGNKRHFPSSDFVLTPSEFVALYAQLM